MGHPHLKVWVCDSPLFLGCSEIKTPNLNPLTKVSGLISDIIKLRDAKQKIKLNKSSLILN